MINDPAVTDYLTGLEPEPDPLLAEMRAHGERDQIPIVYPATGGLLEVLAAATRRGVRSRSAPRSGSARSTCPAAART